MFGRDPTMRRALLAAAAMLALGLSQAAAQQRQAPASRSEIALSFAPIVQRVAPTVVNVFGSRVVQSPMGGFLDDPLFRRFFGERGQGGRSERVQSSLGSGVIVARNGLVVTNHHVVANVDEVKVQLGDRREFPADIVLRDERTDLAVLRLRVRGETFPVIEFADSDRVEVGDLVLAIGNPFGVGQTVTQGIVSALARTTQVGITDYQFFIQTDAAINPGNSGGALVGVDGRLVGINTAIYSRTGASHGIGFAIPASMVQVVVASAQAGGTTVRRPYFGARLQSVTADIADSLGMARPSGAVVVTVAAGGPAARAGLRRNDVILAVDGQEVGDPEAFGFRFATKPIGGEVRLDILRQNRRESLTVRLEAAPETRPREPWAIAGQSPFAGATVGNLSPALADELRLESDAEGVAVIDVEALSAAQQLGLRRGDIVRQVNDTAVDSVARLREAFGQRTRTWRIQIERAGQVLTTVVRG
jgi:Do/DeqQ family serine protease